MFDKAGQLLLSIFAGIVTLAIISVVISKQAQTPQVIQAASSGLANLIAAAVAPVNTASTNGDLGSSTFSLPSIGSLLKGSMFQ